MKTTIKILRPEQIWQPRIGPPAGNRNARKHGRYGRDFQSARKRLRAFVKRARAACFEVRAQEAVKSLKEGTVMVGTSPT